MSEYFWPADYGVAPDHCGDVLRGSYDVPLTIKAPRILDIGANVGAFCIWAQKRWPDCTIYAYEPHPGTFGLLQKTMAAHWWKEMEARPVGVSEKAARVKISSGPNNIGEASVLTDYGTASFEVDLIDAATLPDADILKVDTEGCEALIIRRLAEVGKLKKFSAVMMETHGPADCDWIMAKMKESGFTVTKRNQWHANRCELCYVRTDLLPKDFKAVGPKKVLIATPLIGSVSAHYLGSLLTLMTANWEGRYKLDLRIKTGGSVATARNMAAHDALTEGYDKVFFWDKDLNTEDMNLFLACVNRLLGHDVEFVGATYAAHTKATHFHGKQVDTTTDSRGLKKMVQVPIGFSVIDVSAFRKIQEKFPLRYFSTEESGGSKYAGLYDFFPTGLCGPNTPEGKIARIWDADNMDVVASILMDADTSKTEYYGEDYYFCKLAREAGVEILMDTQFIIPHEETIRMPIPTADLQTMLAEEWRKPAK